MPARPWLVRRAGGSGGLLGQLAQGVFEGAHPRFQGDGTHVGLSRWGNELRVLNPRLNLPSNTRQTLLPGQAQFVVLLQTEPKLRRTVKVAGQAQG